MRIKKAGILIIAAAITCTTPAATHIIPEVRKVFAWAASLLMVIGLRRF